MSIYPNGYRVLTLQQQPTPTTCVQTCLAMALDVPVGDVIARYGDEPMNSTKLIHALGECGIRWNAMLTGALVAGGWYFATVPSLNHRGGNHQILMLHDDVNGKVTLLDPAINSRYAADCSDLKSWSELIVFHPWGALPT